MFYIYILYSESSDIYYVGYTRDYKTRLVNHNTSSSITFSSKHRPWVLKAVFECGAERKEAMALERFIKRQKSRSLIEKIIIADRLEGKLAQLVRVPKLRD